MHTTTQVFKTLWSADLGSKQRTIRCGLLQTRTDWSSPASPSLSIFSLIVIKSYILTLNIHVLNVLEFLCDISHLLFIFVFIVRLLTLEYLYRLSDLLWLSHHLDFLKSLVLFKHPRALDGLTIVLRGATSINQSQNACAGCVLNCLQTLSDLLFNDFLLNAVFLV